MLQKHRVTVARLTDYTFRQLLGKFILGGIHPIGQIFNYDQRREFQIRGTEHILSSLIKEVQMHHHITSFRKKK